MRHLRFVLVLALASACTSTSTDPTGDAPVSPRDVVYDPNPVQDPEPLDDPNDDSIPPDPAARYFEILFVDRPGGPTVADPADGDIPVAENSMLVLRSDDGSTRPATQDALAAESVRFVPVAAEGDLAEAGGTAAFYDRLAASASIAQIGAAAEIAVTPLAELARPDTVDVDPTGQRLVACGINFSRCWCCGVRTQAQILNFAGGLDTASADSLNAALEMPFRTGATECQYAPDGSIYAAGSDWEGRSVLVHAMQDPAGAWMSVPVPAAGDQGVQAFDISPDGNRIVFLNQLAAGGGVTVRSLNGAELPFTLSPPANGNGPDWAARETHHSPRWCDDTHVVWQTISGTTRTVFLADTATRERIDLWSDDNRISLTESQLDCRARQ